MCLRALQAAPQRRMCSWPGGWCLMKSRTGTTSCVPHRNSHTRARSTLPGTRAQPGACPISQNWNHLQTTSQPPSSNARAVTQFSVLVTAKRSSDFLLYKRSEQASLLICKHEVEVKSERPVEGGCDPRRTSRSRTVQGYLAHKKPPPP